MPTKDTQFDPQRGPVYKGQSQVSSNGSEITNNVNSLERTRNKDVAKWYKDINELCGEAFTLLTGNLSDFKIFAQCGTHRSSKTVLARRMNRQSTVILPTQTLIQHDIESVVKKGKRNVSTFSPAAKRRRMNETDETLYRSNPQNEGSVVLDWEYKLLDHDNSVIRFENMIKKSTTHRSDRSQWKTDVAKCRHTVKRTSLTRRKSLYSLSVFL